jgi:hypothetical protein
MINNKKKKIYTIYRNIEAYSIILDQHRSHGVLRP